MLHLFHGMCSFLCGRMACAAGLALGGMGGLSVESVVVAQPAQPQAVGRSSSAGSISPSSDRMIAASVNDKPIYKGEIDVAVKRVTGGQRIEAANLPQLQALTLQQLISQRLLFDFIERDGLTATEEEVEKQIEGIRAQLKEQHATFEQVARQRGTTPKDLTNQVALELSFQKFLTKYGPPERIQAYFDRYSRQFDGTQLRVSHILLREKGTRNDAELTELQAQAKRIKAEIESDKVTFAEAAKRYSAGPSRQDGGNLGFIGFEGPMVEAFNRAAFDVEQGKVSEPTVTPFGVHLITVTEVKAGDKKLDDVREEVMKGFRTWLVDKLIEKEMQSAKIEFNPSFPHFKPGTRELAAAGP